jgi:Acyltransferase family
MSATILAPTTLAPTTLAPTTLAPTTPSPVHDGPTAPQSATASDVHRRDAYLDALRAGSLLVVVLWHCVATRLTWTSTGPHATSPLESVAGLWLGTWVLQIMPIFFYVGGYLHRRSWRPGFVRRRVGGLLRATAPLLAAWAVAAGVMVTVGGVTWTAGTVKLALSPLWFLVVYLLLVVLLPLTLWLHRRLGWIALPLLAGVAVVVDVARLGFGVPWVGWINLAVVWGLAHQAGFHHGTVMRAPRWVGAALVAGGVSGLCALLAIGYPGSMVGVPGDKWSNMSPPTVAIVALTSLQIGLIRLGHPTVPRLLAGRAARRVLAIANRYAMPVFLFHMSVFLVAQAVGWPAIALATAVALAVLAVSTAVRRSMARRSRSSETSVGTSC